MILHHFCWRTSKNHITLTTNPNIFGNDHYIHHPILYIDKKFSDINTVRGIVCHQREAPGAKHLGTNLLTLLSIELRCMRSFLLCFFDKKKLYTVDVFDGCVKDFPRGGAFGVCGQAFGASISWLQNIANNETITKPEQCM